MIDEETDEIINAIDQAAQQICAEVYGAASYIIWTIIWCTVAAILALSLAVSVYEIKGTQ